MIVLDTHTLIWWVSDHERLSPKALNAINTELESEEGSIIISSMSAWEVAMLESAGRLTLTMPVNDWLATLSQIEQLRFLPVDNDVAVASTRLPGTFHKDPADRMIVALARHLNATLITADMKIRAYKHVKTIW